jgi:shikimate dehydrogenase
MTSHLAASQSPDPTTNEPPPSVRLGLIGRGIDHSLAPAFHTTAGQMLGLDVTYELLPREAAFSTQFDEFLIELSQAGYQGVNITVPFKSSGWRTAPDVSYEVATTGVANTVLLGPMGPTKAFNTDFTGFKWAYARHFADTAPGAVAILGAGGVGMAAAAALVDLGASIVNIFDIREDRSHALATTLRERDGSIHANVAGSAEEAVVGVDGVVNGTPVGMYLHPGSPVELAAIADQRWLFDAIYSPIETPLMVRAAEANLTRISGFDLFLGQAIDAFEIFTDQRLTPDLLVALETQMRVVERKRRF